MRSGPAGALLPGAKLLAGGARRGGRGNDHLFYPGALLDRREAYPSTKSGIDCQLVRPNPFHPTAGLGHMIASACIQTLT